MTTIIVSNGSKWAGQEQDPIEILLDVLKNYSLNRTFEAYGDFYQPVPHLCDQFGAHTHDSEYEGLSSFSGNFYTLSHVFNIYTDDHELIEKLKTAIRANKRRSDYLAQPKPKSDKHRYRKDCSCIYCRYEAYRRTCPVCQLSSR